jgi:hypothetical protein
MNSPAGFGVVELNLRTEDFFALAEKLSKWKLDPGIRLMNTGKILGFIQGLRLSAELAYIIRKIVSPYPLHVSWGHLVDENGMSCSPECDIIIHKPGFIQEWNGSTKPIMNFKFIQCTSALAVISCKSFIHSVDKAYCQNFAKYNLKNMFLFAECCKPRAVARLKAQASAAGYKGFFYLYTFETKQSIINRDSQIYEQFIEGVIDAAKKGS